jgi:hypothetical protein
MLCAGPLQQAGRQAQPPPPKQLMLHLQQYVLIVAAESFSVPLR